MSKTCEICGSHARSLIDNVCRICSACSMFYRRNFKIRNTLKCSASGECDLLREKNNRRLCPRCRIEKCRSSGLRMAGKSLIIQRDGLPVDDVPSDDESSLLNANSLIPSTISTSSINSTNLNSSPNAPDDCWNVNPKLAMLTKSVRIFKKFVERQLFLSSIHQNRQLTFDGQEPIQISFDEFPWMENRVLMIACEIIGEILADFDGLSFEDKVTAFRGVAFHACLVSKFYLTMQSFPVPGDSRLSLYPAYYIDTKDHRYFFRTLDEERFQTVKNIAAPFFERLYHCGERARRCKPCPVEFAGLFLLAVYDKLERLNIMPNKAIQLYDSLCNELGQHINSVNLNAFVRLPRLMNSLHDAYMITEIYDDSYSLMGVMFPELRPILSQKPNLNDNFIAATAVQDSTK